MIKKKCCQCLGNCEFDTKCICFQRYPTNPYERNISRRSGISLLKDKVDVLYECNSLCRCSLTCPNRVLQRGLQIRLEIFKTTEKGWAVKTLEPIQKGEFVIEYVGEILSSREADARGLLYHIHATNFIFQLPDSKYSIDPTKIGNIARLFNHSCEPNLGKRAVYVDQGAESFPRIGFFASKNIPADTELTIDYGYDQQSCPGAIFVCRCGNENCKGTLL